MADGSNGHFRVGESPPRVDGRAKVTGAARYVDDLAPADALIGRTLRSTVPHGVLRGIRRDASFDWSAVTVVTAADIPGRNAVALIEDDQPALVPLGGTIRHVDEALALVAAPTRELALDALAHLQPDVDPLPAVFTLDDALDSDVVLRAPDNVFTRLEIHRDDDDIDAILAACDHVVTGSYRTGPQEQMYIEPQGMLASFEGDVARVIGSLQCPYYVHKALVPLLDLPAEQIVVTQAVTGGGFGGKEEYPSMIAAHALLLARAAGRPVKIIYARAEDIAATTKRHPARIQHRLGLRADGTLVAVDIDVVLDGGAYITLSPVVLSRAILHAAGPYRWPHARIVGRAVATNTPPHGAFRGFGAPQTVFACERQIDKAARLVGLDPHSFRRHNRLRVGDETVTGQRLDDSVGSDAVLEAIAESAVTESRQPHLDSSTGAPDAGRAQLANRGGVVLTPHTTRGRGMAFCLHGAGFTGSGEERLSGRAAVASRADGDFEVRSSSTDIGQGAQTIFTQIAAEALGVDSARVHVVDPSTERVPDSGPTVASRTCMIVGKLVERAAGDLRRRLFTYAASEGIDPRDLHAAARQHHARHGEACETATHAPPPGVRWDDATYSGAAYPVFGWAACFVELTVDKDTFEVTIERCVHAVDVGKAIHPRIVQGQIEGGTLQALGWALLESVPYKDGRVLNASMTDCIIPTSADAPPMQTVIVEVPYRHGPHGAKGVGEIPMDGPAAAVANALEDALGVPCDELPLLPETLMRLAAEAARR